MAEQLCLSLLTASEIGYIAGLFDGEGCVSISRRVKQEYSLKHQAIYHDYSLQLTIGNSNYEVLEWLETKCSGRIYQMKNRGNRKPFWHWMLVRRYEVKAFLLLIQPLVIVKREQVAIALKFAAFPPHSKTSYRYDREALWQKMLLLNKRGVA